MGWDVSDAVDEMWNDDKLLILYDFHFSDRKHYGWNIGKLLWLREDEKEKTIEL